MDIQRTWMLLEILDKSRHWPNLRLVHDWAMAELQEVCDEAEKDLKAMAEAATQAKADAEAKAEAAKPKSIPTLGRMERLSDEDRRL